MSNNTPPKELLKRPYERVLIPEDEGGFSAYISEFEGCLAEGETPEEALTNLELTALGWIEAEQDAGRPIPQAWNDQTFSGKLLLRLPKSLHRRLSLQASKEGVSLNQYVIYKLTEHKEIATGKSRGNERDGYVERRGFRETRQLQGRSAVTGAFISVEEARRRPSTSIVERVPRTARLGENEPQPTKRRK